MDGELVTATQQVMREIIADGAAFNGACNRVGEWLDAKYGITFGKVESSDRWFVMRYGFISDKRFETFGELIVNLMGYIAGDTALWD